MKKWIPMLLSLILLATACSSNPKEKPAPKPQASSIFKKSRVEQIRITSENASLYSGKSKEYPIIKELPKDGIYNVVGESSDWYVVETDGGEIGAVESTDVQPHIEAPKVEASQANTKKLTPNESEVLRFLNAERTKKGLNPLKLDMEITRIARLKSQDVIDNDYFSHNSPNYGSPFNMLESYGIKYIYAGENLAGNTSIKDAHQSFMDSAGHRENILNPNFTHIGIGVKEGSKYGKMITQIFVGR